MKKVFLWVAGIILVWGLIGVNLSPTAPTAAKFFFDGMYIYLIAAIDLIKKRKQNVALTKGETLVLLPGLVFCFPSSMLIAYWMLHTTHPNTMKSVWKVSKYACLLFLLSIVGLIVLMTFAQR